MAESCSTLENVFTTSICAARIILWYLSYNGVKLRFTIYTRNKLNKRTAVIPGTQITRCDVAIVTKQGYQL